MRRFELREAGHAPLPAIDLADPSVVIGSGPDARIRLPAELVRDAHVRLDGGRWTAIGDVVVDGTPRRAGDGGELGAATTFAFGAYEVRVTATPAGAPASPPQRTESLARELVRGLLGAGSAPVLELVLLGAGQPGTGRRELAPPESRLVIGRGDEADWVILDQELSREHAEVRRGWDGVTIRDLGSKNGTRVDGVEVRGEQELHDGARVELGDVVLAFHDPAERHLLGTGPRPAPVVAAARVPTTTNPAPPVARSALPVVLAAAIAALAALGLAWILLG